MSTVLCTSTTVFACMSKSCAPPPVGTGGSSPTGAPGSVTIGGRVPSGPRTRDSEAKVWQSWGKYLERMGVSSGKFSTLEDIGEKAIIETKREAARAISSQLLKSKKGMAAIKKLADCVPGSDCDDGNLIFHVADLLPRIPNRPKEGSLREQAQWCIDTGRSSPSYGVDRLRMSQLAEAMGETLDSLTAEKVVAHLTARAFIDSWAETSWLDAVSFSSQRAAQTTHGLPVSSYQQDQSNRYVRLLRESGVTHDVAKAVLDAEYKATQSWLKKNLKGATTVTVFRGVKNLELPVGTKGEIEMNPLSSWTISERVAQLFSRDLHSMGTVFAMEVPVEMIQSTPFTGRGCLKETEMLLIGHASEAESVRRWGVPGG